jgi:arylsulfatase A-like enzyme
VLRRPVELAEFDDYYPAPGRQLPDEIRPLGRPMNKNPGFISGFFDWAPVVAEDSAMADGQVVSWASSQIKAKHDKPLFLGVGIYHPHIPWYVPQTYFDMHPPDQIELPATIPNDLDDVPGSERYASNQKVHQWVLESDNWKQGVQAYLAGISFADAMLGRILDALDAGNRADDTIVVLLSDHGYHLGEKGQWRKYTLWEESTHVPLIVVAPGITTAGSKSAEPVSTLDLYPTLADLAGLKSPSHLEGHSLLPLLKEAEAEWPHFAITTYNFRNHSVRSRHYRYIRYENGDEELYDHRIDPHEWFNLASLPEHAEPKARLDALLPRVNLKPITATWR